ncbi:hypothetical protein AQJ91_09025 [Streptomyces dysideae]|uniref:Uncharacterized protein n=1 Tax=Streptomyces dysideae TaxID=909626 RepID=A0A124IFH9_9ACTN|nr:hypothetical protein AQJ91_09025 [Streptomyces dysideae]
MGAQLVALVFARWTHLNDTDFRILMRMALTALDQERDGAPPHLYFGGHRLLAESLRRPFPQGDSEQARKARQNILKDVQRSVKRIAAEGALEVVDTGRVVRQGEARTYKLTLWTRGGVMSPPSGGVENPPSTPSTEQNDLTSGGVLSPTSGGVLSPTSGGVLSPHEGGFSTPPRNHGGTTEGTWEEDRADAGEQPPDARAPEADDEPASLRLVETDGVRDPAPAGGGVPGQQTFIASVATSSPPLSPSAAPEDLEPPYGPCGSCGRNVLRSRRLCPHCKKPTRIGEAS